MKQRSLADTGFLDNAGKQTRNAVFLSEMETLIPWSRLEALNEPFYSKKGNCRSPMPSHTMLHIHCFAGVVYQRNNRTQEDLQAEYGLPDQENQGRRTQGVTEAINRILSAIRTVVEHPLRVIKRQFEFAQDSLSRTEKQYWANRDAVRAFYSVDGMSSFAAHDTYDR